MSVVHSSLAMALLLLFLLLGSNLVRSTNYRQRITKNTIKESRQWGGMHTNTGKNLGGWLIRIMNGDGKFACGGSYYAPLFVITSANCIQPYRYSLEGASADGTALGQSESDNFALIDTVYTPESYVYLQNHMDIAVVRLKRPIKGYLTEFIKLCTTRLEDGMLMTAVSWLQDNLGIQKPSWDPLTGVVPIENFNICSQKYKGVRNLTDTSFCVTHPTDRKQCRYDGGCPLIYKNQLCGVVSFGPLCTNTSHPGIYTNIHKVKSFIKKIEEGVISGALPRRRRRRRRSIF